MVLTCKICFENAVGHTAQARITPCGHVFCQACATIWFRTDAACPVCRNLVSGHGALIPLYDHDAGVQSSSFGFSDDQGDGVHSGSLHVDGREAQGVGACKPQGGSETACDSGEQQPLGREQPSARSAEVLVPAAGCEKAEKRFDDEDVHVKYVLSKVAERWQQVMVERAKLKMEVARLEKSKQELLVQVQCLTDENAVLKQALSMKFRPSSRSRDQEREAWDGGCGEGLASQSYDREMDGVSPGFLPSFSELGIGNSEAGHCSPCRPLPKPPAKVEERLGASKWELAHTFAMHTGPVHGIAVNPSGNLVATASWDHFCRVYDVHLEEQVAVLAGHNLGLYAVQFSPAKRDLVGTVSSDQTCRLWNTDTSECIRVLEGHTDEVNGLSFKQGTHLLATASDDTTSMIWDAEKGISITTLKGHRHGVYGVRFQPYGNLIATASFDYTAKLWDPRSGEDVQTLRGHLEDVIGVDIDDSGFLLATGSDDKTCRVWDLRMGNPIAILQEHTGEVKRVVFSPFSKLLATTSGDTTIRMFDTSTFKCVHILSSHTDHVFDAAWSPTADFLVTASHDRLWKLWQPRVPSLRNSAFLANNRRALASSPDVRGRNSPTVTVRS